MLEARGQFRVFSNICIFTIHFLLAGDLPSAEATVIETHNISVDIGTLGRLFSPGSAETGSHDNYENVEWFLYVTDPANLELYVYPKHVDLEACCDRVTITTMTSFTSSTGQMVVYTGPNQTPDDPVSIAALVALPTVHSITGMVKIHFTSDHTVALSGFALRFFALHKYRVIPSAYASLPAFSTIGQLVVKAHIPEFTITLSPSQRLWLQVIHMNLSSIDAMHLTECRFQTEKLEFYDAYCAMDDCFLGILCRHSYSVTPITLVSWGHQVSIRSACAQPASTDCAIINYKIYNPTGGMGTCGPSDVTAHMYQQISTFWALEHTWNVYSNPSALDKTWWIQNTNPVAELLIQIMDNQLSRGPDCASERIEIYSGDCMTDTNLVTYFCGGVRDSYKLTASRFAAIRFIGNPHELQYGDMRFSLWIFAGSVAVPTPGYMPNQYANYPGYGGMYGGVGNILYHIPSGRSSTWDDYIGLWVTLIILTVLASIASAAFKYRIRKKMKAKIQHNMVGAQHMNTQWEHPLYTGWTGSGVPPPAVYEPPTLHPIW